MTNKILLKKILTYIVVTTVTELLSSVLIFAKESLREFTARQVGIKPTIIHVRTRFARLSVKHWVRFLIYMINYSFYILLNCKFGHRLADMHQD